VKKIALDVGQCAPDHAAIRTVLQSLGLHVLRAHSADEARTMLSAHQIDLVLINRILDQDQSSGMTLIEELVREKECRQDGNPAHIILVSNYPEYQTEAVRLGASPGFGKDALGADSTYTLLASLIND
jgi:DNA-binding response OmpR family regulator